MVQNPASLIDRSRRWLLEDAYPTWMRVGVEGEGGGFYEGVSLAGEPLPDLPRRAMVQARQIYSFRVAADLDPGLSPLARSLVRSGAENLIRRYSLPSGAFLHAVDREGKTVDRASELYTQAFVLFGLANAYALFPEESLRIRAKALLAYLRRERRAKGGGYTEIVKEGVKYRSNPHMHLFEASLAWMAVDHDPDWHELADELRGLCLTKFVDPATGALCEHFREGWERVEENGRFVFEPGHHFEWSWLFAVYEGLTGADLGEARRRLFDLAETHGVSRETGVTWDEVWSDFTPRKRTSRYWPHCERMKAALRLGRGESADQALQVLFRFLGTPTAGLCFDTLREDGTFSAEPPKASCLYHIVNALSEYVAFRPKI